MCADVFHMLIVMEQFGYVVITASAMAVFSLLSCCYTTSGYRVSINNYYITTLTNVIIVG